MTELKERDWRRLLETIRRDHCVLVLGPDVCFEPGDASQTPLTTKLARQLSEGLPGAFEIDLALVSQLYLQRPDQDRVDLEIDVNDFFVPYAETTSDCFRDLAALPFSLCLSTTPDDFLSTAFREAGKSPTTAFYDFSDPGRRSGPMHATASAPLVFHLLGHISKPASLVLTETELLDFVITVVRGGSGLPDYVTARLQDPQTAFLFIGFCFQNWLARVLLHVLRSHGHPARSFALEGEAFFSYPDRNRVTLFFEQAHSIVFRRHAWLEFAAELRRRYEEIEGTKGSLPEPPPGAPKVFLCHDSRDRDLVQALEKRLHALGLDTWRDAQDLRGGDDWDRQIRHVLRRQVDYMLVCETPRMLNRGESYFHLEITEALERQRRFPTGQRFLIPGTLEPSEGLSNLDHLHRQDLVSDEGLKRLVSLLKEDWQLRRNQPQGNVG